MNGKIAALPSQDDIAQFVRWADLEDALKGIRTQLENMDRPVPERVVIEMSSQTEVGCTADSTSHGITVQCTCIHDTALNHQTTLHCTADSTCHWITAQCTSIHNTAIYHQIAIHHTALLIAHLTGALHGALHTWHCTTPSNSTSQHCTAQKHTLLHYRALHLQMWHCTTPLNCTIPHHTALHTTATRLHLQRKKKENDKGRLLFFNENEENHGEKNNKNNYCFKGRKTNQEGWKRVEKMLPKIVTNMHHAAACPTTYGCLSGFEYVLKWQNIKMFEWNEGRIQG